MHSLRGWLPRLAPVVLAGAGLLCYANALSTPFVFDDIGGIVDNPGIRQLWPPGAVMEVAPDETPWGRPVVAWSLALNHGLGGLDPAGYHLVNLLVHVLAALLLFRLAAMLLRVAPAAAALRARADGLALSVALLWVVHPIATSVTTYTVQRAESWMALFYLLTLLQSARAATSARQRPFHEAVAVLACCLGMASKESMVTAPVAVVLMDRLVLELSWQEIRRTRRRLYAGLALGWVVLAMLMWTWPRSGSVGSGELSPFEYLLTQWQVVLHYGGLVVWPTDLAIDHAWPVPTLGQALPYGLALAAWLAAAVLLVRRQRGALSWLFVLPLLILAPTSSVVPIQTSIAADHRAYLPAAALLALLVFGVDALLRFRFTRRVRALLGVLAIALPTAGFAAMTVQRNVVYGSPISLWQDVTGKQPANVRAWNNLGGHLYAAGRHDEALACFERTLQLDPEHPSALANVGTMWMQRGRPAEGAELLRRSLALRPAYADGWINLAMAARLAGDLSEAGRALEEALRRRPGELPLRRDLAAIRLRQGRHREGLQIIEAYRREVPGDQAALEIERRLRAAMRPPDPAVPVR